MKQVKGSELSEAQRHHALNRFVHRYTRDHRPKWVTDTKVTPVQFASDADWLANTLFFVRKDGKLSELHQRCESRPTWPDNPELRDRRSVQTENDVFRGSLT